MGSPPRLRETRNGVVALLDGLGLGITPAPAGNTTLTTKLSLSRQDHPRACGKHFTGSLCSRCSAGSPPRLRETPRTSTTPLVAVGITPAPAGNTFVLAAVNACFWDHPRACGKHERPSAPSSEWQGSPPRLRETLLVTSLTGQDRGITPAPAGNTVPSHHAAAVRRDHPRACGKHRRDNMSGREKPGSPPRLRETQCMSPVSSLWAGITPAPAGNTIRLHVRKNLS